MKHLAALILLVLVFASVACNSRNVSSSQVTPKPTVDPAKVATIQVQITEEADVRSNTPEPTETPDPTATPTSTPQVIGVATDDVNVRAGPGQNYAVVGTLKKNASIEIKGQSRDGKWMQSERGWVSATYLTIRGDVSGLMIVAAPLTATPMITRTPAPRPSPTWTCSPAPTTLALPTDRPIPTSTSAPGGGGCCKHCKNSQPCGNSCISWSKTCRQPPGCACP